MLEVVELECWDLRVQLQEKMERRGDEDSKHLLAEAGMSLQLPAKAYHYHSLAHTYPSDRIS